MAIKTYRGSCRCGEIKFEADIDLSAGTGKCNCPACWKERWWSVAVKPAQFRAKGGEETMRGCEPGASKGAGGFCTRCGVVAYAWVDAAAWNDGAYVSINVAALDDLDPAELATAPVRYMDGRAKNWWSPPAETRHL